MKRTLVSLATTGALLAGGAAATAAPHPPEPATCTATLCAGVGVADATWNVGAGGGQYASTTDPTDASSEWDPNVQHVKQQSTYGVASRLSIRAIVLQSPGGAPVALVKNDNYLAQDMLTRRTAQILAERGSKVTYENLLVSATHSHSSPYYATPTAGVWLFQDAADLRMFEYQARQTAAAIQAAERGMRPARVGATTVPLRDFHGNIAGAGVDGDGSPTGYPLEENDHGVTVMRLDDVARPGAPRPLATWVNYAQHGESLSGYDLISGDWVAPFERFVDRATGVPVVFSQGAVGSAEGPYDRSFPDKTSVDNGEQVVRAWGHTGYAQAERGAHLLANAVIAAWQAIGGEGEGGGGRGDAGGDSRGRGDSGGVDSGVAVDYPPSTTAPVAMLTRFVPGPVSHPYPSVSNCRTGPSASGDPGVPVLGMPDCARGGFGDVAPAKALWDALRATGAPLPANYDATSFGAVEENARIKLQAVRIGQVLLASCGCEPQSDLIKALETRTDQVQGNRWNGFDVGNPEHVAAGWPGRSVAPCRPVDGGYDCPDPRDPFGKARLAVPGPAYDRMRAQINNPADGWDDPAYAAQANSEPADVTQIKGNFTGRELPARCGYLVPVGLGHTGDYNGYTVSYREYMARDSYRKALTSYGPHTADYMVTRLMSLASALSCGTPVPAEPLDAAAASDEQRQQAEAVAIGRLSSQYLDAWTAQIPDSAPVSAVTEPASITRFDAATFTWSGGDNFTDNPTARVERLVDGRWTPYADQSGEVQTYLRTPGDLVTSAPTYRSGGQAWTWSASFEAFDAWPRAVVDGGQVPDGLYRFVVDGRAHTGGKAQPYRLQSRPFTVSRWTGIQVGDLRVEPGSVSFTVDTSYPRMPEHRYPAKTFYRDDGGGRPGSDRSVCASCTFRPWAVRGTVDTARVSVVRADSPGTVLRTVPASYDPGSGRWTARTNLAVGEAALVPPGGVLDSFGETNGTGTPPAVR